ncbi:MAG: branched-chain amino acid transaminase [Ignavibacteria bacterium]|nr:branched-chain amino acid transaminase [Ignavibacteria bacterium]
MALPKTPYIWMNGEFVDWDKATIHVLSHVVHYGSGWFEGIRAYKTPNGTGIFRLREHLKRLQQSVKLYRGEMPYTIDQMCEATKELVRKNGLESCYIRPIAYRGYENLGVYPLNCPIDVSIACWEWGVYLGKEAIDNGVDVCVSSWQRLHNNTLPAVSKASGNYLSSQLIRMEAIMNGYSEGIGLDINGNVGEGSGENIFFVNDGVIYTPPMSSSILEGITRHTAITIAKDLGYEVRETTVPRAVLYTADEIFFTGTAVEITPVRSVDRISVNDGIVGPVTKHIQQAFYAIIQDGKDEHGWLTYV